MGLDEVEKFGNHHLFAVVHFADGADMDFVLPPAHAAGNGHHLMQVVLHEIAAGLGAAFLLGEHNGLAVGQVVRQVVQQADAVYVGYGFDVKG